ncbi:MAG: urease accessory UreF family protein [Pseudomonadota bacterium]
MTASKGGASLSASSLLQLIWLASPALPVGGFSYSEGLEAAVESGHVSSEDETAHWLSQQLQLTLERSDLAIIGAAIPAWREADMAEVRRLNSWLLQTRETREMRQQTEQMGRSLVEWLRQVEGIAPEQLAFCAALPPTYPVAFALAVSATTAGVPDCLLAFAFGWCENMVQAALKSVPLGQTSGQRILARLAREIPVAVERAIALAPEQRQSFSPMLAILSSQHEHQYSRLFRS